MSNDKVAATFHGGAETLRRAATSMRERASGAQDVVGDEPWTPGDLGWDSDRGGLEYTVRSSDKYAVGGLIAEELAEHVASWHPLVALAVADWLDAVADKHDEAVRMGLGALASGIHYHREATAVARAYLGDQS